MKLLKGNTTQTKPKTVKGNFDTVPPTVRVYYQKVTLLADIMFVNRIAFLITKSRIVNMGMIETLSSMKFNVVTKVITSVINLYPIIRFKIPES